MKSWMTIVAAVVCALSVSAANAQESNTLTFQIDPQFGIDQTQTEAARAVERAGITASVILLGSRCTGESAIDTWANRILMIEAGSKGATFDLNLQGIGAGAMMGMETMVGAVQVLEAIRGWRTDGSDVVAPFCDTLSGLMVMSYGLEHGKNMDAVKESLRTVYNFPEAAANRVQEIYQSVVGPAEVAE
ncbi:MAG: hypothetical protein HRT45_01885 [Bdellovibrionales bacterium]|nr:hypothetical protein [Bdellovibrionales bacterium]